MALSFQKSVRSTKALRDTTEKYLTVTKTTMERERGKETNESLPRLRGGNMAKLLALSLTVT